VLARLALVHGAGQDRDVVTGASEIDRDRLSDPAARSRHQRNLCRFLFPHVITLSVERAR
jgi:hypothetical protein